MGLSFKQTNPLSSKLKPSFNDDVQPLAVWDCPWFEDRYFVAAHRRGIDLAALAQLDVVLERAEGLASFGFDGVRQGRVFGRLILRFDPVCYLVQLAARFDEGRQLAFDCFGPLLTGLVQQRYEARQVDYLHILCLIDDQLGRWPGPDIVTIHKKAATARVDVFGT